jgi:molybdopterin converting factor small subunit
MTDRSADSVTAATIHVRFLGPLRRHVESREAWLELERPVTVRRVLDSLIERHGDHLRSVFYNQYGWMDPRLWVLIDGVSAGARDGLDTQISGGEDVEIVLGQPISGG